MIAGVGEWLCEWRIRWVSAYECASAGVRGWEGGCAGAYECASAGVGECGSERVCEPG